MVNFFTYLDSADCPPYLIYYHTIAIGSKDYYNNIIIIIYHGKVPNNVHINNYCINNIMSDPESTSPKVEFKAYEGGHI